MAPDLLVMAICASFFLAAALYSSVGHAGASAYIALMALYGFAPEEMRPTALVLNILVASIASWRFYRAGLFDWRVLWPFLVGALPMAWLGGSIVLPGGYYKPLVGLILWFSAVRLMWPRALAEARETRKLPLLAALPSGAGIGLLAGLTGTGGGIFLSPLLIFTGWAPARTVSGVAAVFVLANSISGLAGNLAAVGSIAGQWPLYLVSVALGGLLGTALGIRWQVELILRALALVLIVAGAKLIGVY